MPHTKQKNLPALRWTLADLLRSSWYGQRIGRQPWPPGTVAPSTSR